MIADGLTVPWFWVGYLAGVASVLAVVFIAAMVSSIRDRRGKPIV